MNRAVMVTVMVVAGCSQVQPSSEQQTSRRVEVECNVVASGSMGDVLFAELDVPGASAELLEGVRAVGFPRLAASDYLQDFDRIVSLPVLVKDEVVSTMCGSAADAPLYDRVAFILPEGAVQ